MTEYRKTDGGVFLPDTDLHIGGIFHCEHIRDGKVIDQWDQPNLVTTEGLNALMGIMFNGATQITTWYVGLFEGNYTPVAGVTAATITSASTECTAYDELTRIEYVEAAPSGGSVTNSANKAAFTFNASKTIYGAFLVSASAKSATTGTLFSAARFSSSKAVVDDDQLQLTYTLTVASA